MAARARSLSITMAQHGELLQPFCGARDQHVDAGRAFMSTHIAPEAMQSSTNRPPTACTASATALQVVVGQDHAGGGFDVRREHHCGLFLARWRPALRRSARGAHGACAAGAGLARLQHGGRRRDVAHVEDLRPAVAEPAVADDQHVLAVRRTGAPPLPCRRCRCRAPAPRRARCRPPSGCRRCPSSRPGSFCDMWFSARSV